MALGPRVPEETVQAYRDMYHYNDPLPVQYFYWLSGVLRGDFGDSLGTRRPVATDVKDFLPATLDLVCLAGLLQIVIGLTVGIISNMYKNKWPDIALRITGYIGVATPAFVMAVFLLLIFGYWFKILPSIGGRISSGYSVPAVTGFTLIDALLSGNINAFGDAFAHVILPALALSIGPSMQEAKITRSSMLDNKNKEYIAMATTQGIPKRAINTRFLLKPSVIPTISIIGLDFASLFGNAFLVEQIFNWPGLSRYGITAMLQKDINAVCAVVLIFGLVFIIVNVAVDIIVAFLDPRMRQKRAS
jgi:peptide/nickel transport system permease protein